MADARKTDRLLSSLFAGLASAFIARGLGIEWWIDWVPGDAFDIGLCTALSVSFALRYRQGPPND